ncbi:MAG: bacillithiol biosynthesis BshC [Candidatus Eisenbacteria bacterium]
MGALPVRARVEPGPGPAHERLADALTRECVTGSDFARERFAVLWSDIEALTALALAKLAPLPAPLAAELREYHQRLGASPASLASLERLACGEAVCAVAGQQPAPLGGPLYGLHKTAGAAGMAARVTARTGVPCVPLFWTHSEDSDFAEIRSATVGDATLALHDLVLADALHHDGALVGGIPAGPVAALADQAIALWQGLPARDAAERLLRHALAGARDLGEAHSALMLALFGARGLVVVDPRLPAFRAAARGVIDRYLVRAEALTAQARAAGVRLAAHIGRQPLAESALESFVFGIDDGVRHKLTVGEARARPSARTLSPSVALRPVVQDGVLPTVAMACGPGELAYLAQLREVFDSLAVRAACPVPRFSATWLPPAAVSLIEASGAEPWEVVAATDAVLKHHAEQQIPADLREQLAGAREELAGRLERFAAGSTRVDPSLPQMVESARGKVDYQFARLLEGLTGKVRHRLEREHPEWLRLRYYLSPGDRLQERRIASLDPVAWRGPEVAAELCDLAEEHAGALERGDWRHYLVELG